MLFVDDLSYQLEALSFLGSAVAVGGDELMCHDNGRGLWITLENNAREIERIIKKAEALVSPIAIEKKEQSGGAA